ncbi:MAG: flagellar biosynthesis protein FlhB [bacterium]
MADPAKTEPATPKRRQEAREKGQVVRSLEVNSVLILLAAVLTFRCAGPYMMDTIRNIWVFTYQNMMLGFGEENLYTYGLFFAGQIVLIIAPLLAVVLLVSLISNYLQVGVMFSLKPMTPKLTNISPLTGFSRIVSRRSFVELVKAVVKITLIGWISYDGIKDALPRLVPAMDMPGAKAVQFVGSLAVGILDHIIFALAALAILDYLYQRWEYEENLKMTKQEIRDELRQSEGDPLIKARIRQLQREMARRRMFEAIPRADVVVTNPTHVAVALEYKDGMGAPIVLAKGERVIAQKIKEIALAHRIPIVENPPVARALLKSCPVGGQIPGELFETVAEILAFVFRMNKKRDKAAAGTRSKV